MKILVATPLSAPDIGGPATYTALLEAELPQHEIEVRVVSFRGVRHLPKGLSHLVFFLRLLKAAWGTRLMYALDPISVGVPALWAARLTFRPLWVRTPGFYAWEQGQQRYSVTETLDEFIAHIAGEKKRYPRAVRRWQRLQMQVVAGADRVIVPSRYIKGLYEKLGFTNESVNVIYSAFTPVCERSVLDTPRERGLIVTAARLVPWKGIAMLIKVLPLVREDCPEAHLVILGEGPEEEKLKALVSELGLDEYVMFTGRLDHDALYEYLTRAEAFALNTSYEGFSHTLLEAMDAGATIVTTPVGGNVEMIEKGKQGMLVPFDNEKEWHRALSRALLDRDYATLLAGIAKTSIERFSGDKAVEQLVTLLKELEK